MRVAGRYHVVRRKDHVISKTPLKRWSERGCNIDVRIWAGHAFAMPLLLVNVARRQGHAVQRNQFRRRVRMAFLDILRSAPELTPMGAVIWVRPEKGHKLGHAFSYGKIKNDLILALHRWVKS